MNSQKNKNNEPPTEIKQKDHNNYEFSTVTGDENKVRTYTLQNGLKVFLAQNFDAPKIQTYIAVKTGSNNDPADNTGLAHYLEHMLFKGTSKIGSANWKEESKLLNEISDLYEEHKKETNPEQKKEIYKKIDEVSQKASQFAIANEYDKLLTSLGASGTNAHTWLDETVYKNNIPNYELERWLKIEHERFSEIALRLFHTELESVYEEFNRAQDNDSRLVNYALMDLLFPNHQNGQQTTLGKAEHLKNPSMVAIHKYFEEYYVPNNYAMILVGDLQFDETIKLIDDYFGKFKYRELPKKNPVIEKPLTKISKKTVKSPTIPRVQIAWRTDSYGTKENMLAEIAANVLSNRGEAGLLDLNINQKQKMLWAQAFSVGFKNYGYISAVAVPREDQTLDEGVEIILKEIENLKNGNFEENLVSAIIKDFKIQRTKALESADGLASMLYDRYIKDISWAEEQREIQQLEKITKSDIVAFTQNFFKDNYVAVYKEKGINENLIRVDNPGITPVHINRDTQSDFFTEIMSEKTISGEPEFIDYNKEITVADVAGKKLSFVENKSNNLGEIHYLFPFGSDHDAELSLAVQVLQYLGTDQFSAEKLKQEFYKIGISNDFKIAPDSLIISLTGLEEDLPAGMKLLEHWMEHAQADQSVYEKFVETVLEGRLAAKADKNKIMSALMNFAKFGAFSRTTDVISEDRLKEIKCTELTEKINRIFNYPYEIFFYGTDIQKIKKEIALYVKPEIFKIPEPKFYPEPETEGNVYFVDYDMVQMEMAKVAKSHEVNPAQFGIINVFNEYFGRGLSSIVFQEIRERKSLAYSAYVNYQANPKIHHADYITSYIGTQPDKLGVAAETMQHLLQKMPQVELQFQNAKTAALKQIASARIKRAHIFYSFWNLKKLGIYHDLREDIYKQIGAMQLSELLYFFETEIQSAKFNTALLGKRENLDQYAIEKLGNPVELSLEQIFGY